MSTCVNCGQVSIPQTDNNPLPCNGEFTADKCIIVEQAIAYLSLPENTPLNTVITSLMQSLIDARNRVSILESGSGTSLEVAYGLNGLINGNNQVFTTDDNFDPQKIIVWVNNQIQFLGIDFLVTGANQISFTVAPPLNSLIIAQYVTL